MAGHQSSPLTPGFRTRLYSLGQARSAWKKNSIRLSLFLFCLACLLLLAPSQFWKSDGYVEYAVAKRFIQDARFDIPEFAGREGQVREGLGDRVYATYGLGQSVMYVGTIYADRGFQKAYSLVRGSVYSSAEPGFFSTTANAWLTALTALCLMALLEYFGLPLQATLLTVLIYIFGTMALVYAGLSFDIVLSTLLLLGSFLVLFQSFPLGSRASSLAAGLLMGGAFITRPANLLFIIPFAYFVLARLRSATSNLNSHFARILAMVAGATAIATVQLLYNWHRFGSPLSFGYDTARFTTSLAVSVPALLASPGRGILFYSAPAVLALLGLRGWLRHYPLEARTLLSVAALNLCLYGMWYWWATPRTWGPRFLLPTVAILMVPLGFWLSHRSANSTANRLVLALFAISFGLQASASLIGFDRLDPDFTRYWSWGDSQVWHLTLSVARTLRTFDIRSLRSWWISPGPFAIPGAVGSVPLLSVAFASAAAIAVALRRLALPHHNDRSPDATGSERSDRQRTPVSRLTTGRPWPPNNSVEPTRLAAQNGCLSCPPG